MNKNQIEEYVRQSNAIEGIYKESGPEWDNHIGAVNMILDTVMCSNDVIYPIQIHRDLMKGILKDKYVGNYRVVAVIVGNDMCPNPASVPYLMNNWAEKVNSFLSTQGYSSIRKYNEDRCWHFHNYFEAIHPFIDGNGRTGRLILNNLRLICGLDWLTINAYDKWDYYDKISAWKSEYFENEK